MKILAFTDVHGSEKALAKLKEKIKKEMPQLVLCAGDFTNFGNHQVKILYQMNLWQVPVYLIHGNHEDAQDVAADIKAHKLSHLVFFHKKYKEHGAYAFAGYGGGGFSSTDASFEMFMKSCKTTKALVLFTHAPPYKTVLDRIDDFHCGNKSIAAAIKAYQPLVAIAGHIHENNGKQQFFGKTFLVNPGPEGMILDLAALAAARNQ